MTRINHETRPLRGRRYGRAASPRARYARSPARDYPWITDQEIVTLAISVICAATAGWLAYAGFSK